MYPPLKPCEETLFAPGPCKRCGRNPAVGYASVDDDWYCHGDCDAEPTCYMLAQIDIAMPLNYDD